MRELPSPVESGIRVPDPDPFFITFEGPDGSGKTTQAAILAERLRQLGREVVLTREPGGGGPVAESVRSLLLHGAEMAPSTELLLFFAARAEHVASLIRPALSAGKIVICDRYTDSSLAYQGAGLGVSEDHIRALHRVATGDLWPDVTILMDVPPEVGLSRQGDRNRMEERGLEFATRVRDGFLALAAREPDRFRVVDARGSVDEVAARVWAAVSGGVNRTPADTSGVPGPPDESGGGSGNLPSGQGPAA